MARSSAVRALAPLAMLAAAGCQDYNFNPVGHCLVQPGNERVTLSDLSSADILFVVDDSGSMGAEQEKLARNFSAFINNLDATNASRVSAGLQPVDFHIAVTTTSVFWNADYSWGATDTTPSTFAYTCRAGVCVDGSGNPRLVDGQPLRCGREGNVLPDQAEGAEAGCGGFEHAYDFSFCESQNSPPGVAVNGAPYPQGNFVSWQTNPRVLHFDKELYGPTQKNLEGYTSDQLIEWFVGSAASGGTAGVGGNVLVGTCGSGQEQPLQAARLAVQKALAGQQGGARWPQKESKLVLVFVGDEDDCSSPDDPSGGIVMRRDDTGQDSCVRDREALASDPTKTKQYGVGEIVDYFASLGRPLGAAFIFPAAQTTCSGTGAGGVPVCTAGPTAETPSGLCCQTDCPNHENVCTQGTLDNCGAQAPGFRLLEAANALRGKGADVITGSICDPNFDVLLNELAEIVKPPAGLVLPTRPAEGQITVLRIADKDGFTRKTCNGPAPAGTTLDAARASYDWWFTASRDVGAPVEVSQFVYLNQESGCVADAGETYSADYIAVNPAGGCATREECKAALGPVTSPDNPWGCYKLPGEARGTCVCCEPGSTRPECL